jgi:leukotriene-A4 hydrolase
MFTLTFYQNFAPSVKDLENFTANQKLVFLAEVQQSGELSADRAQLMGKIYDFLSSKNVEILSSYYQIALKAQDSAIYQDTATLLGRVGRMKFVRPLFRALNKVDRQLALQTFEKNKDFYHPICKGMVEKDLGL